MQSDKNHHAVPHPHGRPATGADTKKPTAVPPTQKAAQGRAGQIAHKHSATRIHGRDGKIRDANSCGSGRQSGMENKPGKHAHLGFMEGQMSMPDDFDSMGSAEIERQFGWKCAARWPKYWRR